MADGKPDLLLVHSRNGMTVHLHLSTDREHPTLTLCNISAPLLNLRHYFANSGCLRCVRAALKLGYTRVIDIDGEWADLQQVIADAGWRRSTREPGRPPGKSC